MTRTSTRRPGQTSKVRGPRALLLTALAAAFGFGHALISLYWATGGTGLLSTVGTWAVELSEQEPEKAALVLLVVAAGKVTVAAAPLLSVVGVLRTPRWLLALYVLAAVALIFYGGVNTAAAWLVIGGVIAPDGPPDPGGLFGHAVLWDPWFLIWGILLAAGLRTWSTRDGSTR